MSNVYLPLAGLPRGINNYSTGAELLAIMIRTGAPGKSAVEIGKQ